MKEKSNSKSLVYKKTPWNNNANTIWLASSIVLQRNIEKFKFPGKLEKDYKAQIIALISKKLLASDSIEAPTLTHAEHLSPLDKEWLVEHFLSNHNYIQAGSGDGFLFDAQYEFLATLNLFDHLHLQLIDCKGELESTWNRLVKIETEIGKEINYAFHPNFGFLTSDPTHCGTALIASVFLQLPGLIHSDRINDLLKKNVDESMTVTGLQGSPLEIFGDVLRIRNNYTLGLTEENIISSLRSVTTKLIVEENSIRAKIKQEEPADMKDKVSRAYAVLVHSYQIEAVEALNALSLLKFGLELGWIKGTDQQKVNELFFNCRRAHLTAYYEQPIPQEVLSHKRAEMIHSSLKDVKLMI